MCVCLLGGGKTKQNKKRFYRSSLCVLIFVNSLQLLFVGGCGGWKESNFPPFQVTKRATDRQASTSSEWWAPGHGAVEPVCREATGITGWGRGPQLVQVTLALHGVLHVQKNSGICETQVSILYRCFSSQLQYNLSNVHCLNCFQFWIQSSIFYLSWG